MDFSPPSDRNDAPVEVELKFAVAPASLRRLRRHPLLAGAEVKRRALTSTYFDTPDLVLHRRSLALRIRREGRHYVQTLKGGDPSAVTNFERPEWLVPVSRPLPDLSPPEVRQQLGDLANASLQPVFISRIRRITRVLHPEPGTTIELSCDEGRIETPGGGSLPVCELELELKEGDTQALFDLARSLNQIAPLRIEVRSKAARGYALLEGRDTAGAAPQRHGRAALRADMPAEDALAAVARHCLQHMLVNDPAALIGDVEGVHQMRVALRRLRAALKLFKAMIPGDQRAWATGEIRWISRTLAGARNWDVFAELLEPVAQAFAADHDIEALSRVIAAQREEGRNGMRAALTSSRYTDFALQLLTWIDTRSWRQQVVSEASVRLLSPIGELGHALLDRRYRKIRKLAKKLDLNQPTERHQLRIALKELRYAVDALASIYDAKATRRYVRRLAALQDHLGMLQDIATIDQLTGELPKDAGDGNLVRGAAIVLGWYGRVAAEGEAELEKMLGRFLKARAFWESPEQGS